MNLVGSSSVRVSPTTSVTTALPNQLLARSGPSLASSEAPSAARASTIAGALARLGIKQGIKQGIDWCEWPFAFSDLAVRLFVSVRSPFVDWKGEPPFAFRSE